MTTTAGTKRQPGTRDPKERARRKLITKANARSASRSKADMDDAAWEDECLAAYDSGLTYEEIAIISDLSRVRIDQVIRKVRKRKGLLPRKP